MDKKEIVEILNKLDPHNNDQWTESGQPAMNAVVALGGAGLTRKMITEAAPDFTRETLLKAQEGEGPNPVEGDGTGQPLPPAKDPNAPQVEDPNAPKQPDPASEQSKPAENTDEPTPGNADELYAQIAELQKGIDERKAKKTELDLEAKGIQDQIDALVQQIEDLKPKTSNSQAIREYIDTQNKMREQSVAQRNAVLKNINPQDLKLHSQLDDAMKSNRGHGLNRPQRSVNQ